MAEKKLLFVYPIGYCRKGEVRNFHVMFEHLLPLLKASKTKVILVVLNNLPGEIKEAKTYFSTVGIDGDFEQIYFERQYPRGKFYYQIIQAFKNSRNLLKIIRQQQPNVVYGYNYIGTFYPALAKLFVRFKLIFDLRGDRVAEIKEAGASEFKVFLKGLMEKLLFAKTDLLFTVSDDFKAIPSHIKRVPKYNFYNPEIFNYLPQKASEKRGELGLSGRFIWLYSGSDHHYQMIDWMASFFAQFHYLYPESFWLINSSSSPTSFHQALAKANVPESAYQIRKLNATELNDIQMVADAAFLVREDLLLNHCAFPTKFAEYLASGVPVFISPHVHTLVPMVVNNQLGMVVDFHEPIERLTPKIHQFFYQNSGLKQRCATFALNNLTWLNRASHVHAVFNDLLNEES